MPQETQSINPQIDLPTIEDYQKIHRSYVEAYKHLHGQVATFALLPENFAKEVEPAIEKYLFFYSQSAQSDEQVKQLRVITDFITRFQCFMDEANGMFVEHAILCNETYEYLQKVTELDTALPKKNLAGYEQGYIQLIPEVKALLNALSTVKAKVTTTGRHLQALEPSWTDISNQIA